MIDRYWIDDEIKQQIIVIREILPDDILDHALDLIEEMDIDHDQEYRSRLIKYMWKASNSDEKLECSCSDSKSYDIFHEFCFFLDGWLWSIEYCITAENSDIDSAQLFLHKINV